MADILGEAIFRFNYPEMKAVGFADQVNYDIQKNVLEHVVHTLKYVTDGVLPVIASVHGFWAEFYYPGNSNDDLNGPNISAYGYLSDEQGYSTKPNVRMRVAVVGLVVDRYLSGDDVDNYFTPPPTIFATGDFAPPENTKIRILFKKTKFVEYQLDRCEAIYGMDDILVTKLIVLPVSSQF